MMNTLRCFLVTIIFLSSISLNGQNVEDEYNAFLKQRQNELIEFKNKRDQEFSTFLKEAWKEYTAVAGIEAPSPGPDKPVIYEPKPEKEPSTKPTKPQEPTTKPIKPKPIRPTKPRPTKPTTPTRPAKDDREKSGIVDFFGGKYNVATPTTSVYLTGIDENSISDAWTTIAKSDYKNLIDDCLELKKDLQLSDWGYILFTRSVGELLSKRQDPNEIIFAQMFILLQSNYKVRVARIDNKLSLLVSSSQIIYGTSFIEQEGTRYYIITDKQKQISGALYTYKKNFANASNPIDMVSIKAPNLAENLIPKTYSNPFYPHKIEVAVNKNLMDYYNAFPQFDYPIYMEAEVNPKLEAEILAQFGKMIAGKGAVEATSTLLDVIHKIYPYATDFQQFGYEKPFFVEECFYYPKNDCEDRAILFAFLVRNLLNLDVVLLKYPTHLASAVLLPEAVNGKYVTHRGQKYLICDPTYIGAPIGMAMPQFVNTTPKIYTYKKK